VDGHNLLKQPVEYYENLQRESSIAIQSRKLLKHIADVIERAGGEFNEETLSNMPLAQFIVMASRNDIRIEVSNKYSNDDIEVPF